MWGAIVAAVLAAAGATTSAIMGAKNKRKKDARIREQQRIENEWYNRNYNADSTERADVQRLLTKTGDAFRQRNKEISATQAVMGGTEESVAAQRERNNETLEGTTGDVAAALANDKEKIDQIHMNNQMTIEEKKQQLDDEYQQNLVNAITSGVQGVGTSLASLDTSSGSTSKSSGSFSKRQIRKAGKGTKNANADTVDSANNKYASNFKVASAPSNDIREDDDDSSNPHYVAAKNPTESMTSSLQYTDGTTDGSDLENILRSRYGANKINA